MAKLTHIAIIMDGNGRYASEHNKPRTFGHYEGVKNVRRIAIHANDCGISYLTLYAFSTENWKRPKEEVSYLMSLPKIFFSSYLKELMEKNIRITMIGEWDNIPKEAAGIFHEAIKKTANNTGMVLNFALNYGGRNEIVKACKKYAIAYKNGEVDDLNEDSFKKYLYTADFPEVDLLIRTSGEQRLSNFLLYQLAYSELIFDERKWPEFKEEAFDECLAIFANRKRRFGGLDE